MPINLNSIAKTLRAEEKALEKRLGKIKKALVAFAGLSGDSGPKKRRKKMSASARKKIAAAQRARWAKVRAAKKT
jgi:hypothetical protein